MTYNAQIKSVTAQLKEKSNGGKTQLVQAFIVDGPLKGLTVLAQRTVLNAQGVEKPAVAVGDEVTLHHTQQPSAVKAGTMQNFFEVSTGMGATQDDINALMASANAVLATASAIDVPF